jgi:inner membrane protein
MFVGLVFLTFFVFEALSGQRLHPAQYVLVGLAQMVFYLLLLSLSEYVGFDLGFALAAVATVGLIGLYAGWAFKSARYRLRALVIFSVLYVLIYCLMRLEDFALLAGSLASFVGLAAAMYLTRNLEWYGGRFSPPAAAAPVPVDASKPAESALSQPLAQDSLNGPADAAQEFQDRQRPASRRAGGGHKGEGLPHLPL